MFKKLMVLCVGFALCFGVVGCGGGAVETPEVTEPPPEDAPGEADMTLEAPDE